MNSITRLHLVGYFYWCILKCNVTWASLIVRFFLVCREELVQQRACSYQNGKYISLTDINVTLPQFPMVHSVQQKSSGQIFRTSRSGSDVTYSCHHNLSRFSFPIFVHSWRFTVFHSLQTITPRIYQPKTPIHSLNLKLKHELKDINFPRRVACLLCLHSYMLRKGGCLSYPEVAERVNAWWQYSSKTNYIGSRPSVSM